MPITVPQADYSPLYRATELLGEARKATLIPRYWELGEKQDRREMALGIAEGALEIGKAIYNVYQQGQLERAKNMLFDFEQEAKQRYRNYLAQGGIKPQPDGTVKMPDEFENWYKEQTAAFEKTFSGSGEVRRWAKEQLYSVYDTTKTAALSDSLRQMAEDRGNLAQQNLDRSLSQAVMLGEEGDFAPADAQIGSLTWLSADAKAALRKEYEDKFAVGVQKRKEAERLLRIQNLEKGLRDQVQAGDPASAIEYIDASEGNTLTADEAKKLRGVVNDQRKDSATLWQQQADTAFVKFQDGKAPGTASDWVNTILNQVPQGYRTDVEKTLRARQSIVVSASTMDKMNQPVTRDSLPQLRTLYGETKADEGGNYGGIEAQQTTDLDKIESRIKQLEPDQKDETELKANARTSFLGKLAMIESDYSRPTGPVKYTREQARLQALNLLSAALDNPEEGGGPVDISEAYLRTVKAIYGVGEGSPLANAFDDIGKEIIAAMGIKGKGSVDQQLFIDSMTDYAYAVLSDYVGETGRQATPEDIAKIRSDIIGKLKAAQFSTLRKQRVDTTTRWFIFGENPAVEQLAAYQKQIDSGELDNQIYMGDDLQPVESPLLGGVFDQLKSFQRNRLAEQLSTPDNPVTPEQITMRWAKGAEGKDITPQTVFGYAGRDYQFHASADGKNMELFQLKDGKDISWSSSDHVKEVRATKDAALAVKNAAGEAKVKTERQEQAWREGILGDARRAAEIGEGRLTAQDVAGLVATYPKIGDTAVTAEEVYRLLEESGYRGKLPPLEEVKDYKPPQSTYRVVK